MEIEVSRTKMVCIFTYVMITCLACCGCRYGCRYARKVCVLYVKFRRRCIYFRSVPECDYRAADNSDNYALFHGRLRWEQEVRENTRTGRYTDFRLGRHRYAGVCHANAGATRCKQMEFRSSRVAGTWCSQLLCIRTRRWRTVVRATAQSLHGTGIQVPCLTALRVTAAEYRAWPFACMAAAFGRAAGMQLCVCGPPWPRPPNPNLRSLWRTFW
jgi:hypothetical protein